jgi:hypothetical protein
MVLEFKTYVLKEGTRSYKQLIEKGKLHNEFIVIGEENIKDYGKCFKALPHSDEGIKLLPVNLLDQAMTILKEELELKKDDLPGIETCEIDIPKKYLTLDIVEDIQRLNS